MAPRRPDTGRGIFGLTIKIDPPFAQVAKGLDGLTLKMMDLRTPLRRIASFVKTETNANFAAHGARLETPWPEYSEEYATRFKGGSRAATLVASGLLRDSIGIKTLSKVRLVFGTDLPYARAHNFGRKKPSERKRSQAAYRRAVAQGHTIKMTGRAQEKRPFLGVNEAIEAFATNTINNHIADAIDEMKQTRAMAVARLTA